MHQSTEEDLRRAIGRRIVALREAQALSQQKLAEAVGLSATGVGNHENGRQTMSIADACRYADALGCTLDALAGRSTDGLLAAVRTEPVYVIDRSALVFLTENPKAVVRSAEFRGYRWEITVEPDDLVVPRDVWERESARVEKRLRDLGLTS